MPALPPDPTAAGRTVNPARTRLESPLAAAMRGRVYHSRRQPPPRQRGRQVLAIVGTLLVHVFFLFGFVLGAAFRPALPPPRTEQALQVRLIEPPEPPPPPAVRGTLPKERGPRHQGQRRPPAAHHEPGANTAARTTNAPATPPAPAIAMASQAPAPPPHPMLDTSPGPSPPAAAPLPLTRPAAPAPEPPALVVSIPSPLPPAAPPVQPEPVRPPQVEGNRPILPPASLALPTRAAPAPASLPAMAIHMEAPPSVAPLGVMPGPQPPTAAELPHLQPLPLPAQLAPTVTLQAPVSMPALIAPQAVHEAQASAAASHPPLAAPATVASASTPPKPMPIARLDLEALARAPATPPRALLPASSSSIAVAEASPLAAAPPAASAPVAPATPSSAAPANPASEMAPDVAVDVSRAPDATPQGSESAVVGEPAGAASAASTPASAAPDASRQPEAAARPTGTHGKSLAAGRPGGDQPGAMQGAPHGAIGDYIQLKPTGDTEIMRRGVPDIGYRATRFDKDWTPENESSVDTALRRAVEKTTVRHTFHLPRGVRVECAVKPLLPIALFGCRNPDPPAAPVADKVYDRLHLAPADPLTAPSATASRPAPSSSSPAAMIKFDNRAECAAARLAGGPLPPSCPADLHPAQPIHVPASSASSWVPASDQFH